MSAYVISEKAVEDINNIWIYPVENWSVAQADRYYNLIYDEIEYLVNNFIWLVTVEKFENRLNIRK